MNKNEAKKEQEAPETNEVKILPIDAEERKPKLGCIVKWHKEVQTQTGSKFNTYPAIICGFPEAVSNFQPKDMAVQLTVFGQHGVPVDQKYNVIFSAEPKAGRWSW